MISLLGFIMTYIGVFFTIIILVLVGLSLRSIALVYFC